jgi:hypothetical protein
MQNPDLQTLFGTMFDLAQKTLPTGFIPTAATMDKSGQVTLMAAPFDNKEASAMLSGVICKEAAAGKLRASGVMLDVLFNPPDGSGTVDAVVFILEHESGEAVMLHQTYKKGWFRKIKFGDRYEEPLPDQMRAWTKP